MQCPFFKYSSSSDIKGNAWWRKKIIAIVVTESNDRFIDPSGNYVVDPDGNYIKSLETA